MDQKSDSRLRIEARRGDEAAFRELYGRHRTPPFRFAWRLTGSAAAAEGVTQECFLALLSGARFDGREASLRPYLFGITRNLALKSCGFPSASARNSRNPSNADPIRWTD